MAKRLVNTTPGNPLEQSQKRGVEGDGMGAGGGQGRKVGKRGAQGKRPSGRGKDGKGMNGKDMKEAKDVKEAKESRDGKGGVRARSGSPAPIKDGRTKEEWAQFAHANGFESSWRAQVHILQTLGITPSQLSKMATARVEIFNTSAKTLTRKIAFFREALSMSDPEIVKLVCKSPRVLEYGSEQTVRPRIEFLEHACGVPSQMISKVVLKAPMIMSLGMKETLEPRVEFLKQSLHLNKSQMGKLVSRHPQVLTCTEDMMQQRVDFLLNRAGVQASDLNKVVVAHPQVLHYKLDSMMERLEYLSSVGMRQEDIAQAVARFPQIFSLSVTTNMAPKWHYLVEHLGGDVKGLCSYPGYFSLSLNNRIQMRHLYLGHVLEGGAPLPFPLSYLKMSDEKFATEIAGSSLKEYEDFKLKQSDELARRVYESELESSLDEADGDDEGDAALPNEGKKKGRNASDLMMETNNQGVPVPVSRTSVVTTGNVVGALPNLVRPVSSTGSPTRPAPTE